MKKKNKKNHRAVAWGIGLILTYLLAVWLYFAWGKPCSYEHHPIEINELCRWAGSPIK